MMQQPCMAEKEVDHEVRGHPGRGILLFSYEITSHLKLNLLSCYKCVAFSLLRCMRSNQITDRFNFGCKHFIVTCRKTTLNRGRTYRIILIHYIPPLFSKTDISSVKLLSYSHTLFQTSSYHMKNHMLATTCQNCLHICNDE